MMGNILDGFMLNDFQDYSGAFVLRLQKKKKNVIKGCGNNLTQ